MTYYKFVLFVLTIFLLLTSYSIEAQTRRLNKANIYFERKEYLSAMEYYKTLVKKQRTPTVLERMAYSSLALQDNHAAIHYAETLVSKNQSDSSLFLYASILKRAGKYEEAKKQAETLAKRNLYYHKFLASCDSALQWSIINPEYKVSNLHFLNSEYSDVTPAWYKDGIAFASNRESIVIKKKAELNQEPFFDIYHADFDTIRKKAHKIKPFPSTINSAHHELSPSFSHDFKNIYFTQCDEYATKRNDRDSVNRLKLFTSELIDNSWKNSKKFSLNDSLNSFGHSYMDPAGAYFFIASDMPGGYGGVDIYVCLQVDSSKWTDPINLGPYVNTPGDEMYPYYHTDGTLYFASNYHPGMGGFDIFSARDIDGEWKEVTNLKIPINSEGDDFSIIFNNSKTVGLFSSNRAGGLGKEDIYLIEK
jgi:tetratricopeptide (TPR) repeat protein